MKQIIVLAMALFQAVALFAQSGAPRGFNYQAVPRKADGTTFSAGSLLKVLFQIRENTDDGPVRYAEEQTLTVSQQGAVSATIGGGAAVAGQPNDMNAVNWGAYPHFLAVSVDVDGDGTFEANDYFGASQLLSVPYALYAQTTGGSIYNPDGSDAMPNLNGSGTAGYLPKFTESTTLGNSIVRENNGKIGIGTSTPTSKLHVIGDIKASGDVKIDGAVDFWGLKLGAGYGGIACTAAFVPSGNFLLGTSTHRWSAVWTINGVYQTSDSRFKKDIRPLGYGLKEVMQLRPVTYQWRDENAGRKPHLGFIAQELKNVLGEVVHDEEYVVTDPETGKGEWKPTEQLGVAYSEIIPVTVAAIQEQQAQIEALRAEIEQLKQLLAGKK